MRFKGILSMVAVTVGAMLLVGCAQPPTAAVDTAKAALKAAEDAEAATYAAPALESAKQAIEAMNAELATQEAKFALMRSYKKTQELVTQAEQLCTAAQAAARSGKEQARTEAQAALDTLKGSIESARTLLASLEQCPRKPKGFAKDIEQLTGILAGIELTVPEVEGALQSEQLFDAKSQANAANEQATTLITDVESAKTKIGC